MREQRNAYKGSPQRPWVRISLIAADGASKKLELLADTGNPCAIIVGVETMQQFNLGITPSMNTNFGVLEGGWLRFQIPELGLDQDVLGYVHGNALKHLNLSPGRSEAVHRCRRGQSVAT